METKSFTIPNISCNHCVRNIKNEIEEMDGVVSVQGDPESKTMMVTWNSPATEERLRARLGEIQYPAEP